MKILLSAYACEPYRGSEPGIGWKWALALAAIAGNEVHVITRANNQDVIDAYWKDNPKPQSLHFHYYDLPKVWIWAKHHHLPVNVYYACWLYGSSSLAKTLNKQYSFDVAHHLTFGVFRDAPFLYRLAIPVVIGPVGGGEYTPRNLMNFYATQEKLKEYFRFCINKMSILNPFYHRAYSQASIILTKTEDTKNMFQKSEWKSKTSVSLETGIDGLRDVVGGEYNRHQFLFIGRFIYWKGIRLALEAFSEYCRRYDSGVKLIFIGKGDMERIIVNYAKDNHLQDNIQIIKWMDQKELASYYQTSCAMLFPSLHDSSGNVVLESLANSLPVICLQCGGPASVMGNLTDTMINPYGKAVSQVVREMVEMMHRLATDDDFRNEMQRQSLQRASTFLWPEKARKMTELYRSLLAI